MLLVMWGCARCKCYRGVHVAVRTHGFVLITGNAMCTALVLGKYMYVYVLYLCDSSGGTLGGTKSYLRVRGRCEVNVNTIRPQAVEIDCAKHHMSRAVEIVCIILILV